MKYYPASNLPVDGGPRSCISRKFLRRNYVAAVLIGFATIVWHLHLLRLGGPPPTTTSTTYDETETNMMPSSSRLPPPKNGTAGLVVESSVNATTATTATTTTTVSRAKIEKNGTDRLIWFLHFHKAGGTSLTNLAGMNKETKRPSNQGHSHFELDEEQFRWELVPDDALSSKAVFPESCSRERERARNHPTKWRRKEGNNSSTSANTTTLSFREELQSNVIDEGITFVSTEHWFPLLRSRDDLPPGVVLVAVFREPIERLVSSYLFHGCGGNRCPIPPPVGGRGGRPLPPPPPRTCLLKDWMTAESEMYTRMLNGQPFGPMVIGRECSSDYADGGVRVNVTHLENAKRSLSSSFDLVVTLDTLAKRPEVADCALGKVLGWKETRLPHLNKGRGGGGGHWMGPPRPPRGKNIVVLPPSSSSSRNNNGRRRRLAGRPPGGNCKEPEDGQELDAARDANRLDLELFRHAVGLESEILTRIGCLPG